MRRLKYPFEFTAPEEQNPWISDQVRLTGRRNTLYEKNKAKNKLKDGDLGLKSAT